MQNVINICIEYINNVAPRPHSVPHSVAPFSAPFSTPFSGPILGLSHGTPLAMPVVPTRLTWCSFSLFHWNSDVLMTQDKWTLKLVDWVLEYAVRIFSWIWNNLKCNDHSYGIDTQWNLLSLNTSNQWRKKNPVHLEQTVYLTKRNNHPKAKYLVCHLDFTNELQENM